MKRDMQPRLTPLPYLGRPGIGGVNIGIEGIPHHSAGVLGGFEIFLQAFLAYRRGFIFGGAGLIGPRIARHHDRAEEGKRRTGDSKHGANGRHISGEDSGPI